MAYDKIFLPSIKYQPAESRRKPDINKKNVKFYILIPGRDNKVNLNFTVSKNIQVVHCFV